METESSATNPPSSPVNNLLNGQFAPEIPAAQEADFRRFVEEAARHPHYGKFDEAGLRILWWQWYGTDYEE